MQKKYSFILECVLVINLIGKCLLNQDTDSIQQNLQKEMIKDEFVLPGDLQSPDQDFLNIFFTFQLLNTSKDLEKDHTRLKNCLQRLFHSIFDSSTGTPLNIIICTDKKSKGIAGKIVEEEARRVVITNLLKNNNHTKDQNIKSYFPRYKLQFIDVEHFSNKYRTELDMYEEYLSPKVHYVNIQNEMNMYPCPAKYKLDIFYIQFLLAKELRQINKIIILDIDLRIRTDLKELYEYFNQFTSGEVVAMAKEWVFFQFLAESYESMNPKSQLGHPGPFQNLNSGIVLMDLQKLREQKSTEDVLSAENAKRLAQKYKYAGCSDQEFYFVLRYEDPNKVYMLPCIYNYMESAGYFNADKTYGMCRGQAKINHLTGEKAASEQLFPTLEKYNNLFKLSNWCWNKTWTHCY